MKIILFGILLLLSVVLAISLEDERESEYETIDPVTGKRTKRSTALAFLGGVAAGGIFGPILYNRLYGWGRQSHRRPKITFYRGWRPASSGWGESEQSGGWQPVNQGWQSANQGWQSGNNEW